MIPIPEASNRTFTPWDYVVFVGVLLISTVIGLVFGFTGGRNRTTSEFLLADRKMSWFPVSLSLLASFMSAVTVLGNPSESYNFGTMYAMTAIPQCLGLILATHLYHPVFFNLKLTSVYEYLELRFHRSVRIGAALIFIFQMLTYMAVVLYGPSLALSAVTGLNVWIAVCSVGLLCTIYTTIGGIKAVMWTDVFQICIMYAGLLACLIQGAILFGGVDKIWQIADQGKRLEFFNVGVDPRVRHSVWSIVIGGIVIGGIVTWISIFGINQSQVQRILSCPDIRTGRIAMYLNIPGLISLLWIALSVGLVCYAVYEGCDPVLSGRIMAHDQLFPLFVMDYLSHIPALPGLFVSAVFCASLSTLSSGMNSLAAVAFRDIGQFFCVGWSERKSTIATKLLACLFGLLTIALTVLPFMMGSILTWTLSLFGMLSGPLVGVFTLGLFLPWVNWKGALCGLLSGLGICLWVGCAAQIYRPWPPSRLERNIDLCNFTSPVNMTTPIPTTMDPLATPEPAEDRPMIMEWYAISYMWYGPLGSFITCVVAILVSLVTGLNKPEKVDPRLITPVFDWLCCCVLPERVSRKLWCGVRHDENKSELTRDEERGYTAACRVVLSSLSSVSIIIGMDIEAVKEVEKEFADITASDDVTGEEKTGLDNPATDVSAQGVTKF